VSEGGPVLALVHYQARPGCEEQLAGVLRMHWARLRELELVAERPHFAATRPDRPGAFVESFWWAHAGAPQQARDNAELQEVWMRIEDLCVPEGVQHMELLPLD
jgi:hypothetical protein